MNKYAMNFKKWVLLQLPTFLRKPLIASIGFSVVAPLGYIQAYFNKFMTDTNYRLNHNGQVCYLRAVLNDTFDPGKRRITIDDMPVVEDGMVVSLRENDRAVQFPRREAGIDPLVNRRGFGGASGYDFIVSLPSDLISLDISRIKGVVNTYKLASKRFVITYY